jgi:hypothetical protein
MAAGDAHPVMAGLDPAMPFEPQRIKDVAPRGGSADGGRCFKT